MKLGFIKSKVKLPKVKNNLLKRKALFQKLDDVFKFRLTVVAAPAGFGKSTLLSSWIHEHIKKNCLVSWVSFDEIDQDPFAFWKYILYSIDEVKKGSVDYAFSTLNPLQLDNDFSKSYLTILISELANLEKDLLLVLDDLYLAANEKICDDLRFFIKRLPDNVHVILSSRVLPNIGLARLRAEGSLLEIDEKDLAFSRDEIYCFFRDIIDMTLSEKALDCIEQRTEGWVAGLQMAALYLKGNKSEKELTARWSGEHRYVLDYLMDEVFSGLKKETQDFLIETSIVDEMCAGLCDEMLGVANSLQVLEKLDEQNLFVIPLDETKLWYRYHHLFKDFLNKQLSIHASALAGTYCKAASWYEQNDLISQAISMYLKAQMFEQAARLIEKIDIQILFRDEMKKVYEWSKLLPPEMISTNLRLCINVAWFCAANGDQLKTDYYLEQAKLLLGNKEKDKTNQSDDTYAEIMIIHAWLASLSHDTTKVKEYLSQAQNYNGNNEVIKALVFMLNGVAYIYSGDIDKAIYSFDGTLQISKCLQTYFLSVMANTNIVLSKILCGQLYECEQQCKNLLAYHKERHEMETPLLGAVYNDLATVYYEWNELSKAMEYAQKALKLGEKCNAIWITARSYSIIGRIYFAASDIPKAFEFIEKAECDVLQNKNLDAAGFVGRAKAVMLLKIGKLNEAEKWIEENRFNFDVPNFFYHLIEARLLISKSQLDRAEALLNKICEECEKCKGYKAQSEALLLMSMIDYRNGFSKKALEKITRAIHISYEEKYFIVFISEGKSLESILLVLQYEIEKHLVGKARLFFRSVLAQINIVSKLTKSTKFESLSEREIEVIQCIQKGLTNAQISETLYITTNTVKTHISSIYSKFNVHSRTEALIKAKELHIIN
jgi:LuxR family maltose regulon positive regulatory protein